MTLLLRMLLEVANDMRSSPPRGNPIVVWVLFLLPYTAEWLYALSFTTENTAV